MDKNKLHEKIRSARKTKEFSQVELAALLNVSRQTISNWEKGITVPDAKSLEQIAEILQVSVTYFLGDISKETEKVKEPLEHTTQRDEKVRDASKDEIAFQLARFNELYAEKLTHDIARKETLKWYVRYGMMLVLIIVLLFLLSPFVRFWYMSARTGEVISEHEETVYIREP